MMAFCTEMFADQLEINFNYVHTRLWNLDSVVTEKLQQINWVLALVNIVVVQILLYEKEHLLNHSMGWIILHVFYISSHIPDKLSQLSCKKMLYSCRNTSACFMIYLHICV